MSRYPFIKTKKDIKTFQKIFDKYNKYGLDLQNINHEYLIKILKFGLVKCITGLSIDQNESKLPEELVLNIDILEKYYFDIYFIENKIETIDMSLIDPEPEIIDKIVECFMNDKYLTDFNYGDIQVNLFILKHFYRENLFNLTLRNAEEYYIETTKIKKLPYKNFLQEMYNINKASIRLLTSNNKITRDIMKQVVNKK
jgi:hypothetical protein